MADPPRYSDNDDTGVGSDRGPTVGTPRWVKVFGIIALVVVLLFVILLFTKGPHRPGRYVAEGSRGGGYTPPFVAAGVHVSSGAGLVGLIPAWGGYE